MKKIFTLFGIAAIALLSGCAQNCVAVKSSASKGAIVGPSAFSRNVSVSTAASSLSGDLIVGKAMLSNRTDDEQSLRYQFQWFDTSGTPQGQATPWTPITLEPNLSQVVTATAPSTEATQFSIAVCQ